MYDENTFKNYIFWLKVKRVFFMVIFSIIGAAIGVALGELVVNILTFDAYLKPVIITVSTLLFFANSLLVTAGTGKEVQDGYWKIAVLRKLTVISKKLDHVQISNVSNTNTANLSSTLHKVITESIDDDKIEEEEINSKKEENKEEEKNSSKK